MSRISISAHPKLPFGLAFIGGIVRCKRFVELCVRAKFTAVGMSNGRTEVHEHLQAAQIRLKHYFFNIK